MQTAPPSTWRTLVLRGDGLLFSRVASQAATRFTFLEFAKYKNKYPCNYLGVQAV